MDFRCNSSIALFLKPVANLQFPTQYSMPAELSKASEMEKMYFYYLRSVRSTSSHGSWELKPLINMKKPNLLRAQCSEAQRPRWEHMGEQGRYSFCQGHRRAMMAGGTALEIWPGWCRLESAIVGVTQPILWSQGTVSKCHLCPWLSLHTWHYITQQSGLQSGPAQWWGVGGAPWGVNSCPGNATFQHQLLMCKACCSGLAGSRAWENSCILYETETNLLSTEQQQRVIPPTSPTPLLPKRCGPLCEG